MANTPGTLNGTLVAQRTLETLLAEFPFLRQITTDFSEVPAKYNQTVTSRVVVAGTATDYHTTNGYVASDKSEVDVPVTINKHKHHTYNVNDQERSSTNRKLIEDWALTGAHALGLQMLTDLFAVILAATYDQAYGPVAAANFDRDDVVKIRTAMSILNIPDMARFMILHPSWHEGLSLDTTIVGNNNNQGANTITTGKLPTIHGFSVSEFSALPENGENLVGIAGIKDAIVMAARLPDMPSQDTPIPGRIEVVTEPFSGLSLQLRQWYDMALGKEFRTMTLMYGFAAGLSGTAVCRRLLRITKP